MLRPCGMWDDMSEVDMILFCSKLRLPHMLVVMGVENVLTSLTQRCG